ncbi:hypothetical protein BDB00DRAFT_207042 [Zychaea mexicana]|uniref:uncharacterized protein n=1 Tax=Zychaea mexicana TaxID=64656 RepID=UPI0022FF1321|nr:uncharacterized protein BDB00DRAFT_207042 [Zychaea mexicana]KAI9495617.1 hypothetical protein BDB00DRAFT_207042 [Zychaea mexicana]
MTDNSTLKLLPWPKNYSLVFKNFRGLDHRHLLYHHHRHRRHRHLMLLLTIVSEQKRIPTPCAIHYLYDIQSLTTGQWAATATATATAAAAAAAAVVATTPPEATNDTNNKKPLDRYYRLLERSQSIQKELNRISTEYSLPKQQQQQQQQPSQLHPPPSFPPPSVPPPQPPAKPFLLDVRLPSTPPPTPKKDNEQEDDDDPIITPPASPRMKQQVRFHHDYENKEGKRQQEPPLPPLPPPPARKELPPITHVQKKINGLRGFLTRTYQLSNDLVMSRAHITPLRLFTATEVMTGKPKAVLKIVITGHHDYGFSFYWPSSSSSSSSSNSSGTTVATMKPNRAHDVARFALVPDALVQDALDGWIQQQGGVLPPLYQATHILRESIKIYVVYNRYHFNNL